MKALRNAAVATGSSRRPADFNRIGRCFSRRVLAHAGLDALLSGADATTTTTSGRAAAGAAFC